MDETPAEVGLFAELPPNGLRQFEISAHLPGVKCPSMSAVAPAVNVPALFLQMFAACERVPDFELHIRPLGSGDTRT